MPIFTAAFISLISKHFLESSRQQQHLSNQRFATAARQLVAIVFVPPDQVVLALEELEPITLPDAVQPIVHYVEDTYIGRPAKRTIRRLRYLVATLNDCERALEDASRTSNTVDGFHSHLQANILSHHPNIWKLLKVLQKEQSLGEAEMERLLAGHSPTPRRKQCQASSHRVETIVED